MDQFVYITDNTYTRDEVLAMEEHVLGVLDFELTAPTAKTFLRRFIQVCTGVSASGCCASSNRYRVALTDSDAAVHGV